MSIAKVFAFIFLFLCTFRLVYCYINVDPSQTIVTGPGLLPKLVYPARYFYIIAVDDTGKNLTESPGNVFKVSIVSGNERVPCRIWTQVLDLNDGAFLVRYRLHDTCQGLVIKVFLDDSPVAESPYITNGNVYNEECYCPMGNLHRWQDSMQCPTIYRQIEQDLSHFSDLDMNKYVKMAVERFNHPGSQSICNYVILKNEIYRKCHGQHVGFKMFFDEILLSLARKMILPDMELLVNLGDWPLEKKDYNKDPIPMFSWCGSKGTFDIVMPTYDITQSSLEIMGRVSLDMTSVQGNTGPKWKDKIPKGFWRGRDSRRERLNLVSLARNNPHLLNASLTNFFFFRDEEEEFGPKAPYISFFDFFEYKYQVNVDGTVAAYRFPYLLGGNSAVFKQDSDYYEHFYMELEPMVHYIPFQSDLGDLLDKIKWAQENDDKVYQIAQNGQTFARENLMPKDILCYHVALFERFSKKIVSEVKIREGMEHVPQPEDNKSRCSCARQTFVKDEL